jgi:nitrite reductase/ring-hydroxylating ferredoxin subunit
VTGTPGATVRVAQADELKVNQLKLLHTERGRIVLARSDAGWFAFDDRCTHRGASLADGVMICGTVQCPWHGSQFDCASGAVCAGPAGQAIATYRIEERDGAVWLTL